MFKTLEDLCTVEMLPRGLVLNSACLEIKVIILSRVTENPGKAQQVNGKYKKLTAIPTGLLELPDQYALLSIRMPTGETRFLEDYFLKYRNQKPKVVWS